MKICLIQTPVPDLQDDRLDPPVGLLYLVGDNDDTSIVDLSGMNSDSWRENIPEADIYGFSTYTANYYRTLVAKDVALQINPSAKTAAGGPHASALPREVIGDFDYVVVGEGEITFREIVTGELGEGIHVGKSTNDLDSIPFPNYSLVDFSSYSRRFQDKRSFPIFTSRGCPYRCAFCSTGHIAIRRRSVENVLKEITYLQAQYTDREDISFRFKDDLFAVDPSWLKDFAKRCPDIEYSCNIRSDCKPEAIRYLAESGCKWACLGLESGSDKILRMMQKGTTVDKARKTIGLLKSYGISVLGWFIVGFPGETWNTINETLDFIHEIELDKVVVYPLIPYPGTDLWNNRAKYGLRITDEDFSHYFYIHGNYEAGFVYETDELSPSIIRKMRDYIIGRIQNGEAGIY